jgi:hypothetical protein
MFWVLLANVWHRWRTALMLVQMSLDEPYPSARLPTLVHSPGIAPNRPGPRFGEGQPSETCYPAAIRAAAPTESIGANRGQARGETL